jgi:hypothetical protein
MLSFKACLKFQDAWGELLKVSVGVLKAWLEVSTAWVEPSNAF